MVWKPRNLLYSLGANVSLEVPATLLGVVTFTDILGTLTYALKTAYGGISARCRAHRTILHSK